KVEKGSDILFYDLLIKDLAKSGYKYVKHTILNAADYHVPQLRKRFILLASKSLEVGDLSIPGTSEYTTVDDAFSDLPLIEDNLALDIYSSKPQNNFQKIMRDPGYWGFYGKELDKNKLTYHITPKHRPGTKLRFELIRPGEGLRD